MDGDIRESLARAMAQDDEALSKLIEGYESPTADDGPQAGDTYYVKHSDRERHLRVLSVTLTHVYVRYLDTGYQMNVPRGLLARWTKLEPREEVGE